MKLGTQAHGKAISQGGHSITKPMGKREGLAQRS